MIQRVLRASTNQQTLDDLSHTETPGDNSDVAADAVVPVIYSNSFLEGDAFDPFSSTAVPVHKSNHGVLQFFLQLGWKTHLRKIGHADQSRWNQTFRDLPSIVNGCLAHEIHMNALLTCMTIRMKAYGYRVQSKLDSPELTMAKSLRALRRYFSDISDANTDQQIILDILFLSVAEFWLQNYVAMRTHLRMILHIVKSLGGFDKVSPYIREACCLTELPFAMKTGGVPIFPLSWDPGSIEYDRWVHIGPALCLSEIKSFGAGFEKPLAAGFFNKAAEPIIEGLVADIPTLEYIRRTEEPIPADSGWACIRSRALIHKLLSLQRYSVDVSQQELRSQCVTTTLTMLLCHESLCISPLQYSKATRLRLEDSLRLSSSNFSPAGNWGTSNDMLLWVINTGLWAALGSEDEEWFLTQAVKGCRMLEISSYEELRWLMRRFLWFDHLDGSTLMKVAGQLPGVEAIDTELEAIIEASSPLLK